MVVKQEQEILQVSIEFENGVIFNGSKTRSLADTTNIQFENGVIFNGSKTFTVR